MFPAKIGLTLLLVGLSFAVLPDAMIRLLETLSQAMAAIGRGGGVTPWLSEEKTEKATPKKLKESRKEGQVARTQELGAWAVDPGRRAGHPVADRPSGMDRIRALLDHDAAR